MTPPTEDFWRLPDSPGRPEWRPLPDSGIAAARSADMELRVAAAAARAGGAAVMRHLRGGASLDVSYKDGRANPVTAADTGSQRAVTAMIRATFPHHAVIGEEGGSGDPAAPRVWYVDPLDGTANYTHGVPFFCVSVALRSYGQIAAGVVYDPVREEMFAASAGNGATLNGAPLRVSDVARLDRALVAAQAQTVVPAEIRAYAALVERLMSVTGGVRSLGSPALTLCSIAAGRLEAYCEYSMDPWDILAGQLILREAGGTLTGFDGSPYDTAARADVVASNGHIHLDLIAALAGRP